MKRIIFLPTIIILCSILVSCNKADVPDGTPRCVRKEVTRFSKSEDLCNDAKVDEYKYQEKTVYVFDGGTCIADGAAGVMSSDCESMGSLGGFQGNMKINGDDFSKAVFVRTIWKK